MRIFFTSQEIEEIALNVESYQDTTIGVEGGNEQPITCFSMLYSLSSGASNLSDYSETEIRSAIDQVELVKEFFQSIGGPASIDCSLYDKLIAFLMCKMTNTEGKTLQEIMESACRTGGNDFME